MKDDRSDLNELAITLDNVIAWVLCGVVAVAVIWLVGATLFAS